MIWEKMRPRSWDEFIGHDEFVQDLKQWIEDDDLPHILLYGPAGTGKTTIAGLIKRYFIPNNRRKLDYWELNGSDERGIDVIRDLGKNLKNSFNLGGRKLVFIDEAEQLTRDAWKALKKILETVANKARFIFATNNMAPIPEPIVSRCWEEEFAPYGYEESILLMRRLEERFDIKIKPETLTHVIKMANGDLRKLIGKYGKRLIDHPDLEPGDFGADIVEKMSKIFKKIIDSRKSEPRWETKNVLMKTIKKIKSKSDNAKIIQGLVEASENVDVAEYAGHVAGYLSQGSPEDIELTALCAVVAKYCT